MENKKKILLINTPLNNMNEPDDSLPPLGLGYIAKQLEANFDIQLLDAFYEALHIKKILKTIMEINPYAIILNIFTPNIETVKEILENIKDDMKIFIGGLVVKDIYEEMLKWNVKAELNIVIGEGELIIPQILNENPSINTYKSLDNKKVYVVSMEQNKDYFPNELKSSTIKRDIFKNGVQLNKYNQFESYIITSRGCPYNCAFCGAANQMLKKNFSLYNMRCLSKDEIIKEIKEIIQLYPNVKSIRILDDLFLRNKTKIKEAIDIFKMFSLEWRAMIHYNSFINLDDEIYIELKESGCKELFIGIESGDNDILKKINKERDNSLLLKYIESLLKNNINVKGYFIYGFPGETKENMDNTYELFKKIKNIAEKLNKGKFSPSVFVFRPYHGTQLFEEAQKIMENNYEKQKINGNITSKETFNHNLDNYSNVSNAILEDFIKKTK